jgi:signal transduction histidine kinase
MAVEEDVVAALQQLLSNAIKYSDQLPVPDEAWVKVRAREHQGNAVIEIESWGRPIAEDEIRLGKIWDPGYRGRHVRRLVPDGAGLGLARVKRIVEKNCGKIGVTSVPAKPGDSPAEYDHGHFVTTFEITFPSASARTLDRY